MLPVIALVGRPNVGKSTLFNRLTRTRDALVADFSGLTRDRKYGDGSIDGKGFIVIDTGGISGDETGLDELMAGQSRQAIEEADVVLFLVDCRAGVTAADHTIAQHLRVSNKNAFLVANKVDGLNHDLAILPFFELGLGDVYPITASHGRGVASLMHEVAATFPQPETVPAQNESEDDEFFESEGASPEDTESESTAPDSTSPESAAPKSTAPKSTGHVKALATGVKIAIVGRPNVGKSTLVNRMLGEDRVVVFDMPGTTRDTVYIHYERHGKSYTLIDTAGVRRRKNIKLAIEKFSIVKTLQAIQDANVVIVLMDASEGLVDQDLHIMGNVIDAGRALVIAINKWDGLEEDQKSDIKRELDRRLRFAQFADIHFISALHGSGVGNLYKSIGRAYQSATDKLSTNHLTRILEDAVADHQPPLVRGRRIKLRYAHVGGHNPPIIVIHGNQTDEVPVHYTRYLEKTFRRALDLHGTPIRIQFKSAENPFKDKKNTLTARQLTKKRRLMDHIKKSDKKKKKR